MLTKAHRRSRRDRRRTRADRHRSVDRARRVSAARRPGRPRHRGVRGIHAGLCRSAAILFVLASYLVGRVRGAVRGGLDRRAGHRWPTRRSSAASCSPPRSPISSRFLTRVWFGILAVLGIPAAAFFGGRLAPRRVADRRDARRKHAAGRMIIIQDRLVGNHCYGCGKDNAEACASKATGTAKWQPAATCRGPSNARARRSSYTAD